MEYFQQVTTLNTTITPYSTLQLLSYYNKTMYQFTIPEDQTVSCCIFGSSGNAIQCPNTTGSFIDTSIQLAVRLNHAPTKRYESYIGSNTHIRWIAFNAFQDVFHHVHTQQIDASKEIWIVWGPPQKRMEMEQQLSMFLSTHFQQKPIHIFFLQPSFLQFVDTWFFQTFRKQRREQGIWWSSGFLAHFYFIMLVYQYQHLFQLFRHGFYQSSHTILSYHYWDTKETEQHHIMKQQTQLHGHRFLLEHSIYQYWMKQGFIKSLL